MGCIPWMDKSMHGLATAAVLSKTMLCSSLTPPPQARQRGRRIYEYTISVSSTRNDEQPARILGAIHRTPVLAAYRGLNLTFRHLVECLSVFESLTAASNPACRSSRSSATAWKELQVLLLKMRNTSQNPKKNLGKSLHQHEKEGSEFI